MAYLYITEYSHLGTDREGKPVPVGREPGTEQRVTFTTATQSTAFAKDTRFVRIQADADCFVLFGANPTATAANAKPMTADASEYFGVDPLTVSGLKLSVYDGSS
jgi:hypothetical protein